MKLVFLFLLLSVSNLALAQEKDTLTIHYGTNESSIHKKYYQKLDSFIKTLADSSVESIEIYGYTDHTGSDVYNLNLSNARANKVRLYLLNRIRATINTTCKGMGKVKITSAFYNPSHENWLFRKVELIVISNKKPRQIAPSSDIIRSTIPILADSSSLVIRMGNMKIGESLVLNTINFEPASCIILEESIQPLNELLKVLLEYPTLKIEIQGHTDCTPAFEKAKILSTDRARAIYDFLVGNGINSKQLQYIGYGNSRPIINDMTAEAGLKNRRVELKIIDK